MKTQSKQIQALLALALLAATCASLLAGPEPGVGLFHITYDNASEVGFGTYAGQPNPNFGRLTLALSHTFTDRPWSNHFHRIGSYGYSGDPANPVEAFSGNNRVPEPYQMDDGLALAPGSGAFAGKLVSGIGPARFPGDTIEQEYGDLTIRPMDALLPFDGLAHPDPTLEDPNPTVSGAKHPVNYLINASSGAYKNSIQSVRVGMELVSVSDGLTIHDPAGGLLFNVVGDVVTLGEGADWSFSPTFAVDQSMAAGGRYSATFRLIDQSATPAYGDSAEFSFDFVAIPEPSGCLLAALAAVGLGVSASRR